MWPAKVMSAIVAFYLLNILSRRDLVSIVEHPFTSLPLKYCTKWIGGCILVVADVCPLVLLIDHGERGVPDAALLILGFVNDDHVLVTLGVSAQCRDINLLHGLLGCLSFMNLSIGALW